MISIPVLLSLCKRSLPLNQHFCIPPSPLLFPCQYVPYIFICIVESKMKVECSGNRQKHSKLWILACLHPTQCCVCESTTCKMTCNCIASKVPVETRFFDCIACERFVSVENQIYLVGQPFAIILILGIFRSSCFSLSFQSFISSSYNNWEDIAAVNKRDCVEFSALGSKLVA
jgi:hypothetical protein